MRSSCLVFVTTASSAPSLRRFVLGHGFSRAATAEKGLGFSLCGLVQRLKSSVLLALFGTTEVVP